MSDLNELNQAFNEIMREQNNRPQPEFEGYSPAEMHAILWDPFGPDCPMKLNKLSDADYSKIPLLNQIHHLATKIDAAGEMKLTQRGYLSPGVITELYSQGFLKDEMIESGFTKLNKESDSIIMTLTANLITLTGIVKKRNNKFSLTKQGKSLLSNMPELLKNLLITFGLKFNWAYFDGYGENNIGQLGFAFSLILLKKYGADPRPESFYADKYFNAFPQLIDSSIQPRFGTLQKYVNRCYSLRTFERFIDYFGLITIQTTKPPTTPPLISKTLLFDKLITIHSHIPSLTSIHQS